LGEKVNRRSGGGVLAWSSNGSVSLFVAKKKGKILKVMAEGKKGEKGENDVTPKSGTLSYSYYVSGKEHRQGAGTRRRLGRGEVGDYSLIARFKRQG